jgi:hypothetical protein
MDTDLRNGTEHMPALHQLIEDDPDKFTKNNVVPIGIMNLSSIYMSGIELFGNERRKILQELPRTTVSIPIIAV